MKSPFLFVLLSLPLSFACHAEAPAAIRPCVECHGATGIAAAPKTPHLNGQSAAALTNSMNHFIDGRLATEIAQHRSFASGDVAAMANFYAEQSATGRPVQHPDAALAAKGEALYVDRCSDCHLDGGRDADKDAPYLAGQDRSYLAAEMLKFKLGTRKFAFKMDEAYRGLSDDDLAALAEFFAAQPAVAPAKKKRRR